MRSRLILFLVTLLLLPLTAAAQDISFYWESWNASINVSEAEQTLTIAESQTFVMESGSVARASRVWLDPVTINTVYLNTPQGDLVELRRAASGETPGTYTVSATGDQTTVRYFFPEPVEGGDTFLVQFNYTAPLVTENLLDWYVIPEDHAAPVNSSTVQINFLDSDAPPEGLARVVSNNAVVTVQGQTVSIMIPDALEVDEPLYIQMPFGAEVGAASNNQSGGILTEPTAVRAQPGDSGSEGLFGMSFDSLLPILCIIVVVILIISGRGGGGLINLLLNLFLSGRGGSGGGFFGGGFFGGGGSYGDGSSRGSGGSANRPSNPSSGGFRRSGNQNRSVPSVRNRKGGGSSGLG